MKKKLTIEQRALMEKDELQRHLIQFRCINHLTSYSLTKEEVEAIKEDLDKLIVLLPSSKSKYL